MRTEEKKSGHPRDRSGLRNREAHLVATGKKEKGNTHCPVAWKNIGPGGKGQGCKEKIGAKTVALERKKKKKVPPTRKNHRIRGRIRQKPFF